MIDDVTDAALVRRILYVSRATEDVDRDALEAILEASRRNNVDLGVTGFLTLDGEHFIQLLEGDEEVVRSLFERIERDPRHRNVRVIHEGDGPRLLPSWAMHYEHFDDSDDFVRQTVTTWRVATKGKPSSEQLRQLVLRLKLQSSVGSGAS